MASIGLRVQGVQEFKWFNKVKGSFGSRARLVQGLNWFKGSIGARIELVQGFNWFKS